MEFNNPHNVYHKRVNTQYCDKLSSSLLYPNLTNLKRTRKDCKDCELSENDLVTLDKYVYNNSRFTSSAHSYSDKLLKEFVTHSDMLKNASKGTDLYIARLLKESLKQYCPLYQEASTKYNHSFENIFCNNVLSYSFENYRTVFDDNGEEDWIPLLDNYDFEKGMHNPKVTQEYPSPFFHNKVTAFSNSGCLDTYYAKNRFSKVDISVIFMTKKGYIPFLLTIGITPDYFLEFRSLAERNTENADENVVKNKMISRVRTYLKDLGDIDADTLLSFTDDDYAYMLDEYFSFIDGTFLGQLCTIDSDKITNYIGFDSDLEEQTIPLFKYNTYSVEHLGNCVPDSYYGYSEADNLVKNTNLKTLAPIGAKLENQSQIEFEVFELNFTMFYNAGNNHRELPQYEYEISEFDGDVIHNIGYLNERRYENMLKNDMYRLNCIEEGKIYDPYDFITNGYVDVSINNLHRFLHAYLYSNSTKYMDKKFFELIHSLQAIEELDINKLEVYWTQLRNDIFKQQ